jgi:hypothetical protein
LQQRDVKIITLRGEVAELSDRVQKAEALAADVVTLKAALVELQHTRANIAAK